ncbi:hypothetical protein ACEPAH_4164 [Sanghuangporus vaninii]
MGFSQGTWLGLRTPKPLTAFVLLLPSTASHFTPLCNFYVPAMVSSSEREDASPLLKREIMWRDRYTMLESHGYRLRQRYKPDWKPSWLGTKRLAFLHEDFHKRDSASSIDALRVSDGRRVFLKRVPFNSQEIVIHRFLSQPDRLEDPNNHTAPLLDTFADDKYPHFSYLVLPLLRNYFDPEFYFVDEVVDFIGQLLDGLSYMHMAGVAHRDCSILNIKMDADPLFPKGFHPTASILDASGSKPAYPKRRRDVDGVRYYFIDFGISSKFELGEERKVTGIDGQDDEVPELSESVPYNPFQTDIFIIGNLVRKEFLKKYTNLNFLEPLVEDLIDQNPRERSKASEAKANSRDLHFDGDSKRRTQARSLASSRTSKVFTGRPLSLPKRH